MTFVKPTDFQHVECFMMLYYIYIVYGICEFVTCCTLSCLRGSTSRVAHINLRGSECERRKEKEKHTVTYRKQGIYHGMTVMRNTERRTLSGGCCSARDGDDLRGLGTDDMRSCFASLYIDCWVEYTAKRKQFLGGSLFID